MKINPRRKAVSKGNVT